jgi:AcrR family transcriptional regulator
MTELQRGSPSPVQGGVPPEDPPSVQDTLVREPLQDRSRRTLERLVAAAARLLEEHGPDAVTVTGVAREARTSVGAFYARFSGKEEMVRYLGERWLAEALERWRVVADAVETGGRAELRHGMTTLAGLYLNGPARRLALLHGQDDPKPSRLRRFEDRVAEVLATGGLVGEEGGEADLSDPTRFLRAVAVVAGVRELGVRATEGQGPSAGLGPGTLAEIMVGPSRLYPGIPGDAPEEGVGTSEEEVREPEDEVGEEEPDVFDVWG